MNELISVIVPIFNTEKYIEKSIRSILRQTYKELEIILVDDGSTDSCPQICDRFEKEDSRVKVIHKKNGGLSDARNVGMQHASGEYYVFVDSDDYIESDMIEQLYRRIIEDHSDMAMCDFAIVDEDGNLLKTKTTQVEDSVVDEERFWNEYYGVNHIYCVVAWNKLFRRRIFDTIRFDKGKIHEDEYIIHKIVSQCKRISFLKKKYYYYVRHANSIMGEKFSIKSLDYSEAFLNRSLYFRMNNQKKLAEVNLIGSIGAMQAGYRVLSMKDKQVRARLRQLHMQYRREYINIIKGKPSLRFAINGATFFIGIHFYNWTHTVFGLLHRTN